MSMSAGESFQAVSLTAIQKRMSKRRIFQRSLNSLLMIEKKAASFAPKLAAFTPRGAAVGGD